MSKLRFCTIFILKMILLPRQARDKHRENSKRNAFSVGLPSGHVFVQEAGALFGVADAATAAKALGYTAAAARHHAALHADGDLELLGGHQRAVVAIPLLEGCLFFFF